VNISKETATDIAFAYRELETAQTLLDQINGSLSRREQPDLRDAFGRSQGGLQLGVPSGSGGHSLYNVPWSLARPVIEAHIAQQTAIIATLSEKARIELSGSIGTCVPPSACSSLAEPFGDTP
jgi:hypothetical protein